jgi:hypothetical protein
MTRSVSEGCVPRQAASRRGVERAEDASPIEVENSPRLDASQVCAPAHITRSPFVVVVGLTNAVEPTIATRVVK